MNNSNSSNEHLQRELHALRSRVEYLEQQEAGQTKYLESLRIRDAQFRHFFEQSTDSQYMVSSNGLILDINTVALGSLGYTKEELIGKPVLSLYAPESHSRINELFNTWKQTGEINKEEVEVIAKQGIRHPVLLNVSAVRDLEGRILHSISTHKEITNQKQMDPTLNESEQRFRELIDLLPQTVVELDMAGNFTYMNPYGLGFTGYEQEDLENGLNILQLIIPEDRERGRKNVQRLLRGEEFYDHEYTAISKDGSLFPVLIYASPITRFNEIVGVRGIAINISTRVLAQEALQNRIKVERILSEISARFVAYTDLNTEIETTLNDIGNLIQCDDVMLMLKHDNNTQISCSSEWVAPGIRSIKDQLQNLPTGRDPWWNQQLKTYKMVSVSDVSKLPMEAQTEKDFCNSLGIQAHLTLPIYIGSEIGGHLGFTELNHPRNWAAEDIRILQVCSEIIGGALSRNRFEEELTWESNVNAIMVELGRTLIQATTPEEITSLVLHAAQSLTTSEFGFVSYLDPITGNAHHVEMTKNIWEPCQVSDTDLIQNAYKGLWSWIFEYRQPLITNDLQNEPHTTGVPPGHIPIQRLLIIPAIIEKLEIGQVALANPVHDFTQNDVDAIKRLTSLYALTIQRMQVEAALQERVNLETLITSLSTQLANLSPDAIESGIKIALQAIGEFMNVDRSYIGLFSENRTEIIYHPEYEWCAAGIESRFPTNQRILVKQFPWWSEKLKQGEIIHIQHPTELPAEAHSVRENLEETGILSTITIPLIHSGEVIGLVGFHSLKVAKTWPDELIMILKLIGEMFGNAIEHKQTAKALDESESRYRQIIETTLEGVWVLDAEAKTEFVNPKMADMLGYTPQEMLGKPVYDFMNDKVKVKVENNLKRRRQGISELLEYQFYRRDGSELWTLTNTSPLFDEKGEFSGALGMVTDITERKHAEIALRIERDKAQQYLDIVGVMVIALDSKGEVILINKKGCEALGYSEEEILGKNWIDTFLPEQQRENVKEVFHKILSGELDPVEQYENQIVTKSGEERIIAWQNTMLKDDTGQIIGTLSSGTDITEQKRMTAALRIERDKAQQYLDIVNVIIVAIDTKGEVILINKKGCEALGYPEEEILGKNWFLTFLPERQHKYVKEDIHSILYGEFDLDNENPIVTKSGEERIIAWQNAMLKDDTGQIIGNVCSGTDITDQKRMTETLRVERDRAQYYLDMAGVLFVALDTNFKITLINKQGCDILGYTEEEVLGQDWVNLVMPKRIHTERRLTMNKAFTGESPSKWETVFPVITKRGEERIFEWHSTILTGQTGNIIGSLSSGVDITERRRIEAAQKDLEERRTNFITMTSHELRTPLNAIKGYTEILEHRFDTIQQADREFSFSAVKRNVRRLERLITGVSTLTQLERGIFELNIQQVDLCKLINEAMEPYRFTIKDQLEINGCSIEKSIIIDGDPDRLLQILENLMENAIKHTTVDNRHIVVSMEHQLNSIRILVSDSGDGISPTDLDRIFEPFISIPTERSVGGTGIGLYISRMLAKQHGGSLTAYSDGKGQGATFILDLPRKLSEL